jgi:hypothetical protein
MTFAQMGDALDQEIDESIGYYFNNVEKSYFLNKAVDRWRDKAYREFEVNEEARNKLRLLVKNSTPQVGAIFALNPVSDLTYILRVYGNFSVTCGGATTTQSRRIKPNQLDDLDEQDPFSKGTNEDPRYEEIENQLFIKSTTAPSSVTITYLKALETVDIDTNPGHVLEIPDQYSHEIIDLARDIALENVNSPRYATSVNDAVTQT